MKHLKPQDETENIDYAIFLRKMLRVISSCLKMSRSYLPMHFDVAKKYIMCSMKTKEKEKKTALE